MKNYKVKFRVIKDNKHDGRRKDKKFKTIICYPKYKAKAEFDDKKIEFSKHDFGTAYTIINFKENIKINKRFNEYGMDFIGADKSMVILSYKKKGKNMIITQIEIIGV